MSTYIIENEAEGLLALFQTSRLQRAERVARIVEMVLDGSVDPLQVHLQAKCAEDQIKALLTNEDFKSAVLDAAQQHGKSFEHYNAKWSVKESAAKYDYSATEDTTLADLTQQADQISEKIKARQKFLQNIPESGIADPETGAMIYRAPKSSTTTVAVTLQ